jgi:hypothetical protein
MNVQQNTYPKWKHIYKYITVIQPESHSQVYLLKTYITLLYLQLQKDGSTIHKCHTGHETHTKQLQSADYP